MTSASSRLPAMTATWKKDGEEWGKQSQKRSKRPHKSERRKLLDPAARNSVRHRWSYVVRDPGTYVGTYRCHRDPRTYARHPPWMGVVLSTTVSNGSMVHTQAERMMACRESIKRWQSSPKHYLPMQPRWLWSPFKGGLRDDFCGLGNPPPYSNTVQLPSCYIILHPVH